MRILAIILILVGSAALLAPGVRGFVPLIRASDAAWQWISFGSMAMAALVYFLAPKD